MFEDYKTKKSVVIVCASEGKGKTSAALGLTARHFPAELLDQADIATDMTKIRHHFDQKFLANPGVAF